MNFNSFCLVVKHFAGTSCEQSWERVSERRVFAITGSCLSFDELMIEVSRLATVVTIKILLIESLTHS